MSTKILYLEDEPFLGKIVKESLESRSYHVNMVEDGLHALPAFEQYQPDICILDVMLPNMDGFTIGREIRKQAPSIPIIYLTAKNQTKDLLNGFKSGGNDYIKKPFSMEELIVRVENLLELSQNAGKAKKENPDQINIGQFKFFPKKYELQFEEEVSNLSYKESQLLQILCQHQNQILERKVILKKIWGDDSFFNSRNLDVYITKLRDRLKKDEQVRIITLKGVGYQFLVEK